VVTRQDDSAVRRSRPDASMSLLTDLFQNPIDEGYAEAAARRAAAGEEAPPGVKASRSTALMLGLLGLGLLLTIAVLQVQQDAGVVSIERASLVEQIRNASERTSALEEQVGSLERDILAIESEALRNLDVADELRRSLDATQTAAGTTRVTGPGVVVELNNADAGAVVSSDCPPNQQSVLDLDLQVVINGLWAAGAEAVSINGERITPMTAIRKVDDVILVNIRPIGPPYQVSAIGDPDSLGDDFLIGSGGNWLRYIATECGIEFDIVTHESLTLPGGSASLQVAQL
jgi:uncharacterized protein YlxW (UPF0749 family)